MAELQQDEPDDFVLTTGRATEIRKFVEWTFEDAGIALDGRGSGVEEKRYDRETGK